MNAVTELAHLQIANETIAELTAENKAAHEEWKAIADRLQAERDEARKERDEWKARYLVLDAFVPVMDAACRFRNAVAEGKSWEDIEQARIEFFDAIDTFLREEYDNYDPSPVDQEDVTRIGGWG